MHFFEIEGINCFSKITCVLISKTEPDEIIPLRRWIIIPASNCVKVVTKTIYFVQDIVNASI